MQLNLFWKGKEWTATLAIYFLVCKSNFWIAMISLMHANNKPVFDGFNVDCILVPFIYFFIEVLALDYFWSLSIFYIERLAQWFPTFIQPWSQHMVTGSVEWLESG